MSEKDHHTDPIDPPFTPGEYRIIPVEHREEQETDGFINVPALLHRIAARRKLMVFTTAVCLLVGIAYALVTTVQYKSTAKVLPQTSKLNESELGNLFQNFGGLLGVDNLQSLSSSDKQNISPQVYPEIVKSLDFQYAMMQDTVYFASLHSSKTLYQYFEPRVFHFYSTWFSPGSPVGDMDQLPDTLQKQLQTREISNITPKQQKVINVLRNRIQIEFIPGPGLMKVTARMPDPVAAAQVCNKAIKRLTRYIKEYQTQKANHVLQFANKQYQIARQKFRQAQSSLANFKDKHINLSTATAQSREKYLQSQYDLAYSVYNNIAQKRIQARMDLQKNTPIFKTVQAADIPLHRFEPQWLPILIISIMVGLVISFLVIGGQLVFEDF